MTVYVDPPRWAAHGRLWSHLVSDVSIEELHAFADRLGLSERLFEGDHYDLPEEHYAAAVAAGAVEISGTALARVLRASGLRFRKRRGERPLARVAGAFPWLDAEHSVDVIASPHEPPAEAGAAVVVLTHTDRVLLVRAVGRGGWEVPGGKREGQESVRGTAVREVAEEVGIGLDPAVLVPLGYERITLPDPPASSWDRVNHLAVLAADLTGGGPAPPQPRPEPAEILEARWCPWPLAQDLAGEQVYWPLLSRWRDRA